jgi:hypothetical protein
VTLAFFHVNVIAGFVVLAMTFLGVRSEF